MPTTTRILLNLDQIKIELKSPLDRTWLIFHVCGVRCEAVRRVSFVIVCSPVVCYHSQCLHDTTPLPHQDASWQTFSFMLTQNIKFPSHLFLFFCPRTYTDIDYNYYYLKGLLGNGSIRKPDFCWCFLIEELPYSPPSDCGEPSVHALAHYDDGGPRWAPCVAPVFIAAMDVWII